MWANGFNTSSTFDSTKLHDWPGIQSHSEALSGGCYYGYGHGYVINTVEGRRGGGQMVSTSLFNKIERILKQMFAGALAIKLILSSF